jgi:hypothetical protein
MGCMCEMITLRISVRLSAEARQRLVVWLLFGVLLGLLPLAVSLLRTLDSESGPDWSEVLRSGDLILISAILTGSPIGELFVAKRDSHSIVKRLFAAGISVFLVAVEAAWYSQVALKASTTSPVPFPLVERGSLICLSSALVAGFVSTYLGAAKEGR